MFDLPLTSMVRKLSFPLASGNQKQRAGHRIDGSQTIRWKDSRRKEPQTVATTLQALRGREPK